MLIYNYSEARQKFSKLLEEAESNGKVLIRRKDGKMYALIPENGSVSPLDVPSIKAEINTDEIVSIIRQSREKGGKSA
jgi:hypothetical protein